MFPQVKLSRFIPPPYGGWCDASSGRTGARQFNGIVFEINESFSLPSSNNKEPKYDFAEIIKKLF
jgi:hypothetical protein